MRLLALDTTAETCSAAICEDHRTVAELTLNKGLTHARHIMKVIAATAAAAGYAIKEMDGFAVTVGPGSFTGLRIGVGTVKGLAMATGRPVAPVSSLLALAWQGGVTTEPIYPCIDARRHQVYWAAFRNRGRHEIEQCAPETVTAPEALVEKIGAAGVLIGDGARHYRQLFKAGLGDRVRFAREDQHHIRASAVGVLGLSAFQEKKAIAAETLVPVYLRPADAKLPPPGSPLDR